MALPIAAGFLASSLLKKKKGSASPTNAASTPAGSFAPMQAPTQYSSDVVEAGRDVRRAAAKRKGYMATIKAGETNSNAAYTSTAGVRSLIGVP